VFEDSPRLSHVSNSQLCAQSCFLTKFSYPSEREEPSRLHQLLVLPRPFCFLRPSPLHLQVGPLRRTRNSMTFSSHFNAYVYEKRNLRTFGELNRFCFSPFVMGIWLWRAQLGAILVVSQLHHHLLLALFLFFITDSS
jgi:hypothetical protein